MAAAVAPEKITCAFAHNYVSDNTSGAFTAPGVPATPLDVLRRKNHRECAEIGKIFGGLVLPL